MPSTSHLNFKCFFLNKIVKPYTAKLITSLKYTNMLNVTCMAHGLLRAAEEVRRQYNTIKNLNLVLKNFKKLQINFKSDPCKYVMLTNRTLSLLLEYHVNQDAANQTFFSYSLFIYLYFTCFGVQRRCKKTIIWLN